jgi:hypothetical protein
MDGGETVEVARLDGMRQAMLPLATPAAQDLHAKQVGVPE